MNTVIGKFLAVWKRSRKNKIRIVTALLCVAALFGASGYTLFLRPMLSEETFIYIEETVERGDLVMGIMESGTVSMAETTIDYLLDLTQEDEEDSEEESDDEDEEDTIRYLEIEEVMVAAGQRIREGDALLLVSEESLAALQSRLDTALTEAEIAMAEAGQEYEQGLLEAESTYETSRLEGEYASRIYQGTLSSLQAQIDSYSARIQLLEAEIAGLWEDLEDETLYETLDAALSAYTAAEELYQNTEVYNVDAYTSNYNDYISAKNTYEQAQEAIDSLQESIQDKQAEIQELNEESEQARANLEADQRTAKQQYEQSLATGENAQAILGYTQASLEETRAEAETALEEAREDVGILEDFVGEDGVVYADGSGLVTAVNYAAGDELMETGTVISYVQEGSYTITIDVLEEDIPYLSVGDSVEIAFAAYAEENWEGEIGEIATTAGQSGGATVSYPVVIEIKGNTDPLYGGMTADVTFVTDRVEDVLYVSRKAIVENGAGETCVYRKERGDSYVLEPVETGLTDGMYVEIKGGLEEGDVIYIESRASAETTVEPE